MGGKHGSSAPPQQEGRTQNSPAWGKALPMIQKGVTTRAGPGCCKVTYIAFLSAIGLCGAVQRAAAGFAFAERPGWPSSTWECREGKVCFFLFCRVQ